MKQGEKIKGSKPPHGGTFKYDPATDELECIEEPTEEVLVIRVPPAESEGSNGVS